MNSVQEDANSNLLRVALNVSNRFGIRDSKVEVNGDCRQKVVNYLAAFSAAIGAIINESRDVDIDKLRGLKVLDLGCGGAHADAPGPISADIRFAKSDKHRTVEPWLCRTLAAAGADVTGVDVVYPRYVRQRLSKKEKRFLEKQGISAPSTIPIGYGEPCWKFVQRDLTEIDALDPFTFPSDYYDAVCSTYFIGHSDGSYFDKADDPMIRIMQASHPAVYNIVVQELNRQILRVLKPGGYCLWNKSLKRKMNGELVTL